MKYSVPTYTSIPVNSSLVSYLNGSMGYFQTAFEEALEVGLPVAWKATKSPGTHDEEIWKNALKFAEHVCKLLNIRDTVEIGLHHDTLVSWFGRCVYVNAKEYTIYKSVWYERAWKAATAPKPKKDRGVLYYRNDIGKITAMRDGIPHANKTFGMSVITPTPKAEVINTLTEGKRFEEKSKKINVERRGFLDTKWGAKKASESRERFVQIRKIFDQRIRDRSRMINDAIKETLGHSHLLTFMGPIHAGDSNYFALHGMNQMADTLRLIGVQTRNEAEPIELHDFDTRLLKHHYDKQEINGHSIIAKLILPTMKGRAAERKPTKTVKKGA